MEYISSCTLFVNGTEISDFKEVTEHEVTRYKPVNLMNKTGHVKQTPRYGLSLVYVVPKTGTRYNFSSVVNGTCVIIYDGGEKRTYSGVYILKEGEEKTDSDNEKVMSVDLGAENRI